MFKRVMHIGLLALLFGIFFGVISAQAATKEQFLADRVLGEKNAPVTIVEYSSFTCPHCAQFHADILPKLKKEFIDTGKVKLIMRAFPLDNAALSASILAYCAPSDRFYPLADTLFENQKRWAMAKDTDALAQYGNLAGVSKSEFDACKNDKAKIDGLLKIRQDAEKKWQIQSTPTFILNDGAARIDGAKTYADFKREIEKLLNAKK